MVSEARIALIEPPYQIFRIFNNPASCGITEIYPFREMDLSGIHFIWEYGFKVEGRNNEYKETATSSVEDVPV